MDNRLKYMLPKAENLLRLANNNIVENKRRKFAATVEVPPLVERAYTIVNETGVIPYKDYPVDAIIRPKQ